MVDDLKQLLNTCYEIEGLITLIGERKEDAPKEVCQLLKTKTDMLQTGVLNLLAIPEESVEIEDTIEEPIVEQETVVIEEPQEEHEDAPELNLIDDDENEDVVFVTDEVGFVEEPVGEYIEDSEMLTDEVFDEEISDLAEDDLEEVADITEDTEDYCDDINIIGNDDDKVLNVEQMIACQGSKDLRKAFTINDKFRFRRELFGNSDTEMTDAINLASAMTSLNEATEYFYNDLEWDAENEDVKDFMTIIANHFKAQENQ